MTAGLTVTCEGKEKSMGQINVFIENAKVEQRRKGDSFHWVGIISNVKIQCLVSEEQFKALGRVDRVRYIRGILRRNKNGKLYIRAIVVKTTDGEEPIRWDFHEPKAMENLQPVTKPVEKRAPDPMELMAVYGC